MHAEPKPTRPSDDDPRRERRVLELEAVEGVGAVRVREIREGLRRLQEHNLVTAT